MASRGMPVLTAGNALTADEVVSNVATNLAADSATAVNGIAGKDIAPETVTTQRFSAVDGIFHGMMKSGSLWCGTGGVTITSDAAGAKPNTGLFMGDDIFQLISGGAATVSFNGATGAATFSGTVSGSTIWGSTMETGTLHIGSGGVSVCDVSAPNSGLVIRNSQLQLIKAGQVMVQLDGATGDAFFRGTVTAGTITQMNSVNFGVDVTIGGDIIMFNSLQSNRGLFFSNSKTDGVVYAGGMGTIIKGNSAGCVGTVSAYLNGGGRILRMDSTGGICDSSFHAPSIRTDNYCNSGGTTIFTASGNRVYFTNINGNHYTRGGAQPANYSRTVYVSDTENGAATRAINFYIYDGLTFISG